MIKACQGAQFCHGGHGDGPLDPPSGLEGLDDRRQTPGVHRLVPCVFQTLQAFGRFGDRVDVCRQDHLRRWSGTDPRTAPAQVGGAPVCRPRSAAIVWPSEGVEPPLGGREIPKGLVPCSTQVADGLLIGGGDRDGGELS
jgi:hypothetical protein